MKTIVKLLLIVILFANAQNNCNARDSLDRKAFVSIHSGVFFPSVSGFKDWYHSHHVFINGISLGIPFTNRDFFFYLKGMYSQKSGTQIIYHFEFDPQTGELIDTYTTKGDNITWRQLLGNIGIHYNLNFGLSNNLIFNGGVTLIKQSERTKDSSASSNAKGLNGFFLGVGYEKKILDAFGIFSEVQYNFDMWKFKILGHDIKLQNGGANFNIGVRYYFNPFVK